jgi:hypothetical protein
LFKPLAHDFIPKLIECTHTTLMTASPDQLRNTKLQFIEDILKHIHEGLLMRLGQHDKAELADTKYIFQVQVGKLLLKTHMFATRIDGLKLIGEVSSHCRSVWREANEKPTTLKPAEKKEKQKAFVQLAVAELKKPIESCNENGETVEQTTLFSELFSKQRTHKELVQRTE